VVKTAVGEPDPAAGPNWAPIFTVNTNTLAVAPRWIHYERRAAP
jgi:hypothetical protein